MLELLVLKMSGSLVSATKPVLWFSKCCLERNVNRKSAERVRYLHANVQSRQTQLSRLMDAQKIATSYLNKNAAATLLENRQTFLLCWNCRQCPFKSMLFLLILLIFLPFSPIKFDCSLIASGISEGECCSFLILL